MKKILSIVFSVCFAVLLNVSAFANLYEYKDLYSVDIPENFQQTEDGKFISDDNSTFIVSYEDNAELKYCVADLSEKKLKEAAEFMASEASNAFKAIGEEGKMELVSVEKIKHPNGMYAAVAVYKTSAIMNGEEKSHLQKVYEFGGANNKYTFVYTPYDDGKIDALDETFDSIIINEAELPGVVDKLGYGVVLVVIVILLVIGILRFFRKPTPKKKK